MSLLSSRTRRRGAKRVAMERLESRVLFTALLDPLTQPKFVNPLPLPGAMQPTKPGGTTYNVSISEFNEDLGVVNPATGQHFQTTVYGYNGSYPGPTIEARQGVPIKVTWNNNLVDATGKPLPPLMPVDPTLLPASEYQALLQYGEPVATHVHGGHTEAQSDGTPQQWFTPGFTAVGPDWAKKTLTYSNSQEAATLWYHDHAMGVTRLNAYSGLAGFYIIRSSTEDALNLPSGKYEIPLAIQDKQFTADGQLYWPSDVLPGTTAPAGQPSVHPEMFGNVILVNGKEWPVLDVEPRKYRLRMLDGSDSRFYDLSLSTGQTFTQIGSDDGLLNAPVTLNDIQIAPGERADAVVDFSKFAGKTIILTNSAKAPFPGGTAADPQTVGQIMAFRVDLPLSGTDTSQIATRATPFVVAPPDKSVPASVAGQTRDLALFEGVDNYNRLRQLIGTPSQGGIGYMEGAPEQIVLGNTEYWRVYNTTADVHPIHLHQVEFQVISRQSFKASVANVIDPVTGFNYGPIGPITNITYNGPVRGPNANEQGPKDTVEMYPGEVTIIQAHFDLPGLYVFHCHILSHEEHDMMRAFFVQSATKPTLAASLVSSPTTVTQTTTTVAPSTFSQTPVTTTTAAPDALTSLVAPTPDQTAALGAPLATSTTTTATDSGDPLDKLVAGVFTPIV